MKKDKETPSDSDGTEIVVADAAATRLAILKTFAAGAVVFGIAGMTPTAAAAGQLRLMSLPPPKGPITYMNLDGKLLVGTLEQAGLNPKLLNLQSLLGDQLSKADINELEKRLLGESKVEWKITITINLKA